MPLVLKISLLVAMLALAPGGYVMAQDDARATLDVDAEIIEGLDTPGQGSATAPGLSGFSSPGQAASGQSFGASDPDGTGSGQSEDQFGQNTQSQQIPAPTTEQVAAVLMQSGNTGTLSLADTSLVAALAAGTRGSQQNLDALVTVTVIDKHGNVTNRSMQQLNIPADVFGQQVGAAAPAAALGTAFAIPNSGLPTIGAGAAQSGQVMRRNTGTTYFYVQVCACSL